MPSFAPRTPKFSTPSYVTGAKALLAAACSLVSVWGAAQAATLGDLNILSERGQHLQAEVPVLDVDAPTAGSLKISVADRTLSEAAGLVQTQSLPFLWAELRQRDGGQWYATILSGEPIVDPYNEIILELVWPGGSYLREYALRFGASTRLTQSAVPATAPADAAEPALERARAAAVSPTRAAPTQRSAVNSVTVANGDSLISVVRALAMPDINNEQLMLAIFQSNPQAFAGSPDKLLAGQTLTVPSRAEVLATPLDQTIAEIADTSLSSAVSVGSSTPEAAKSTLQDTAAVENDSLSERDPTLPLYSRENSSSSNAESDNAGLSTPVNTPVNLSLSRVVAVDTHDAVLQRQADSASLTLQLAGLDASLNAVSSQLSNMENSVTALSETVEENTFKVGSLDVRIEGLQDDSADAEETLASQGASASVETAVVENEVLRTVRTEVPVTVTSNGNLEEGIQDSIASSSIATAIATKGRWRDFMDSGYVRSLVLLGIALALALILIARQVLSQRKNRSRAADDQRSLNGKRNTGTSAANRRKTEPLDETSSVDADAEIRQPSVLRRQEESVDAPTALTWFREHLQSPKVGEEALVKALRQYPNRQDLRLRLMERYANRKEVESFAQLGREMFLMTRGRNKEWPQAIQLALALELEMESLEPELVPSYRAVDLGVDRDIESPFSGDSTQQFLAFSRDEQANGTSNAAGTRRAKGRRNPLRPDVRLDQTLV